MFRADAALAQPGSTRSLEERGVKSAIRLPAREVGHLPVETSLRRASPVRPKFSIHRLRTGTTINRITTMQKGNEGSLVSFAHGYSFEGLAWRWICKWNGIVTKRCCSRSAPTATTQ